MDLKLISNGKKILSEEEDFLLTLFNLMYEYYNDENEIFKDIKEDNTVKKSHYHCILKLDNACTISALSKRLDIPTNYIQNVRNERTMVRYLIHLDDPLKAQYDKNDIVASPVYSRYVNKCFEHIESEEEQLSKIYTFVSDLGTNIKINISTRLIQILLR